jgi:hypothetical protein
VQQQRGEVEVAERRDEPHALERIQQPRRLQPRAGARVQRQDDRVRQRGQQGNEPLQALGVVHGARPVRGREQEGARLDLAGLQHRRALARPRGQQLRDVHHHVAHDHDLARDVLVAQVAGRRGRRAQQQVGGVVGEHAVELLGHRAVERAHPRLHMGDRDPHLRRGQRAGQRRVRVAVDEHHVGALGRQQRRQRGQHAARLLGVGAAAQLEQVLGPRQLQLVEEDLRQLRVVVLARVDEHLLGGVTEPGRDRGGLHELRSVANDG